MHVNLLCLAADRQYVGTLRGGDPNELYVTMKTVQDNKETSFMMTAGTTTTTVQYKYFRNLERGRISTGSPSTISAMEEEDYKKRCSLANNPELEDFRTILRALSVPVYPISL